MSERYERAAAVSVFRGDMKRGIMTLTDGANLARQQGKEEKGGYFNPHTFTTITTLTTLTPSPASQLQLIALSLSGYPRPATNSGIRPALS